MQGHEARVNFMDNVLAKTGMYDKINIFLCMNEFK
jgi:hypothetical protein